MFLRSKSEVHFLTDQEKISRACEYMIWPFLKMKVTLSKRKDLLLLYENYFMYILANNCLVNTNLGFLLVHKIIKKIIQSFSQPIQNVLRMKPKFPVIICKQ